MESSRVISPRDIDRFLEFLPQFAVEFANFSLHQLQVDVEGIQRIPDLVGDPGSEQRERIEPFGFDRLFRRTPGFSDVAENNRVTDGFGLFCSAGGRFVPPFDQERDDVEIQEPVRGIKNLHVAADRAG